MSAKRPAQDMSAPEPYQKSTAREYFESICVAVILALFVRTFVVQAFKIPTGSMENNLLIGGHDARRGKPFAYYETLGGGHGGGPAGDSPDHGLGEQREARGHDSHRVQLAGDGPDPRRQASRRGDRKPAEGEAGRQGQPRGHSREQAGRRLQAEPQHDAIGEAGGRQYLRKLQKQGFPEALGLGVVERSIVAGVRAHALVHRQPLRSPAGGSFGPQPAVVSRASIWPRARCRKVLTVPRGMPVISAISS